MIIFMGVSGAGKSVQGNLLAEKMGYEWLSIGEYLRANVTGERRVEMLAGKLLGDQEIIEILSGFFEKIEGEEHYILDGFPRTLPQAKWLLEQDQKGLIHIAAVIYLNASKEVVRRRLMARGRKDDTPEALDRRFDDYEKLTLPIIDWLKEQGVTVHEVDAERSIEEIQLDIQSRLNLDK